MKPHKVSAGQWGVFDKGTDFHVIPLFGKGHELSRECWCKTKLEDGTDNVIVHFSHEPVAEFKRHA